ncbi:MAG: aldose 1-epimerase family protein [Clostridia bacterium]|jgi:hypothetical protein|nr:aldose 1-epimerase family protein [Clostridia bacterium]
MATIFNREYTKEELMKYIGDISQVADARICEIKTGRGKGVSVIDVRTGGGLSFSILPDRGMDIAWSEHKGIPLAHISKTGVTSPFSFDDEGIKFFRSFTAGLLTTCGLTYMGAPCIDDGQELGVHGRIGNIPAEDVSIYKEWEGDDFVIKVRGKVRESAYFAENITLTRTITINLGENKVAFHDVVENCGFETQPIMLLYHFNFGHPLVGKDTKLFHTSADITPRDDVSSKGMDSYDSFHQPEHKYAEQVFFFDMNPQDAQVFSCLYNETLGSGLGVYLNYKKSQLKLFTEWKQMGEGDYVVAMEPCNSTPIGRVAARESGILEYIQPGEKRCFDIELGIVEGKKELKEKFPHIKCF